MDGIDSGKHELKYLYTGDFSSIKIEINGGNISILYNELVRRFKVMYVEYYTQIFFPLRYNNNF